MHSPHVSRAPARGSTHTGVDTPAARTPLRTRSTGRAGTAGASRGKPLTIAASRIAVPDVDPTSAAWLAPEPPALPRVLPMPSERDPGRIVAALLESCRHVLAFLTQGDPYRHSRRAVTSGASTAGRAHGYGVHTHTCTAFPLPHAHPLAHSHARAWEVGVSMLAEDLEGTQALFLREGVLDAVLCVCEHVCACACCDPRVSVAVTSCLRVLCRMCESMDVPRRIRVAKSPTAASLVSLLLACVCDGPTGALNDALRAVTALVAVHTGFRHMCARMDVPTAVSRITRTPGVSVETCANVDALLREMQQWIPAFRGRTSPSSSPPRRPMGMRDRWTAAATPPGPGTHPLAA